MTPPGRPGAALQRLELPVSHWSGNAAESAALAARMGQLRGVSQAVANPLTGRAVVLFDPSLVGIEGLLRTVTPGRLARPRVVVRWHLPLAGPACARCAARAEAAVGRIPGVEAVIANQSARSLTVEFIAGDTDLEVVRTTLLAHGFAPEPAQAPASATSPRARGA